MKVSKTLTSTLAAATLVGAFGLVYAQSGTTTPPADTAASPAMPAPDTASPSSTMNQGAMTQGTTNQGTLNNNSMPSPTTPATTPMVTERPAQADRN